MTRRTKASSKEPKPEKAKLPQEPRSKAAQNQGLAQQNRKLLGKHYAAKYGKKRGG